MKAPKVRIDADPLDRWRRLSTLGLAIVLSLAAVVIYWVPGASPADAQWLSGLLAKLAIVVAMLWLAFPQIRRLQRMPGGSMMLGGILVLILVFLVRPRLVVYALPMVGTGVGVLMTLKWFSRITPKSKS